MRFSARQCRTVLLILFFRVFYPPRFSLTKIPKRDNIFVGAMPFYGDDMELAKQLAAEFNLQEIHSENIISLIDEGNTIPFIARYRKEMHNSCDDQVLREFADRLTYLRNLAKRKEEVFNSVTEQGKMTEEVAAALERAQTLTEVEDVYRPFKQKKKTRASVAIEKGLQPLADLIYAQQTTEGDISELAAPFVNAEKGVENSEQALKGAADIIAEMISDDAELRKSLREFLKNEADISTKQINPEKEEGRVYEMYADHSEKIAKIPAHRVLAINRGEKEECLKVGIVEDREAALAKVKAAHVKGDSIFRGLLEATAEDAYDRLIFPSIEREVRNELTDMANEQAIKMFEVNLRPLLMQPPLKGKTILAVDPAYRTGCKIAVIDPSGNVLDTGVVYPHAAAKPRRGGESQAESHDKKARRGRDFNRKRHGEQGGGDFCRRVNQRVRRKVELRRSQRGGGLGLFSQQAGRAGVSRIRRFHPQRGFDSAQAPRPSRGAD